MLPADPFPLGAAVTLEQLDVDPHPVLAQLRALEPVSWIGVLDGWLVTRHDLALHTMRDSLAFTVDDPRFSTAQVVGPSMLSLDGGEHGRHRGPFVGPFRPGDVRERFEHAVAAEAGGLIEELRPAGAGELRGSFAGPLVTSIVTRALGFDRDESPQVLSWYDAIVAGVTEITSGRAIPAATQRAFSQLSERLTAVIERRTDSLLAKVAAGSGLSQLESISNAAVLLFGGIETTEGMIANAALHLLERPELLQRALQEPRIIGDVIEESLRFEPAAAVVDRYATADVELADARIQRGDLVRVSIAGANRDPAVFACPDQFDLKRGNARRHLAFAHGPHVCLGIHLARLEARLGLRTLLGGLPGLRLDPDRPAAVRGLVFRKPTALHVLWDNSG